MTLKRAATSSFSCWMQAPSHSRTATHRVPVDAFPAKGQSATTHCYPGWQPKSWHALPGGAGHLLSARNLLLLLFFVALHSCSDDSSTHRCTQVKSGLFSSDTLARPPPLPRRPSRRKVRRAGATARDHVLPTIASSSELPHRWSSVVTLKRAAHITSGNAYRTTEAQNACNPPAEQSSAQQARPRNRLAKSTLFFTSITNTPGFSIAPAAIPTYGSRSE